MALIMAIGILAAPAAASAHVIIRDSTGQASVLLHITPDDDPVAGKPSGLYFTLRDSLPQVDAADYRADLLITDKTGRAKTIPLYTSVQTMYATYTFPATGVYNLRLTLKSRTPEKQGFTLDYDLRISKGTSIATLSNAVPLIATVLVAALSLLAVIRQVRSDRKRTA